jgi:hypothetical protein
MEDRLTLPMNRAQRATVRCNFVAMAELEDILVLNY